MKKNKAKCTDFIIKHKYKCKTEAEEFKLQSEFIDKTLPLMIINLQKLTDELK